MVSRQTTYNHRQSVQRLRALVPEGCPVTVDYRAEPYGGCFVVKVDGQDYLSGRHQVVYEFIRGYVLGWRTRIPMNDAPPWR